MADCSISNVSHLGLSVPTITMRRPIESHDYSSTSIDRDSHVVVENGKYNASCQSLSFPPSP